MALLIALSFIYYLNMGLTTSKVLYIPQGSIHKIITQLMRQNPQISGLDRFLIRWIGRPQHGWIDLGETRMTHGDFLYRLCTSKAAMKPVTLIPGETTWFFFQSLAESLRLDRQKLFEALERQSGFSDGVFVPDTYQLPLGISETGAVTLLLAQSRAKMQAWSHKIFGRYNEAKWFHYVTVASVIQKEAASAEEMPLIASVIFNRLAAGMKLQMDGTLNYGPFSHTAVTPERIRNDASPFNTYRRAGLPKSPVCNVGFEAIKAAIFPAKTEYLYFVKGPDGTHRFARYFSTHKRNINSATK